MLLTRIALRHPRKTILAGVVLVFLSGLGIPRLEIRTDGHALVPPQRPEVLFDQSVREVFGIRDQIVVVVRNDAAEGIFTARALELIAALSREFSSIPGLKPLDVLSLATEKSDRVFPGTLTFRAFLDPLPQGDDELEQLRNDLRAVDLYSGTLVSRDGRAAAILVRVPELMDRVQLVRRIHEIIAPHRNESQHIHVVGAPVAEALLGHHLLDDLGVPAWLLGDAFSSPPAIGETLLPKSLEEFRAFVARRIGLLPAAIAVMALVFLFFFRSLRAVLLPLSTVAACLIFVFGCMGWLGVPIYLTLAVMPVILTATGVTDEIHIFYNYREHLKRRPQASKPLDALELTMAELWRAIVKTSLTTAIGFAAFTLSPIGPVRAFGAFTAAGVLFCLVWSLAVIPAILALADPEAFVPAGRQEGGIRGLEPLLESFTGFIIRHRLLVLLTVLVVSVVSVTGLRKLHVQDSWIDSFAPESEFRRATEFFHRGFLGSHVLLVTVDTADRTISGRLEAKAVDHYQAGLPARALDDSVTPEELVGRWIDIRIPAGNTRRATPATEARKDESVMARIASARRDGDSVMVTTDPRFGSLRLALDLSGAEEVEFQIGRRRLLLPQTYHLLCSLSDFIRDRVAQGVGGVIGPCEFLRTTSYLLGGRREEARRIPEEPQHIQQALQFYKRLRGAERLSEFLDRRYARTVLAVYLKEASFVATRELMEAIRAYEREHLLAYEISLDFAGDVAVSQTLIDAITTTQVRSLLLSLLGILITTSVLGKSLKWGVLCIVPCALSVLISFSVMGLMDVPLGVATSMFAAMTLGIAVDYPIHLLERYRLASSRAQTAIDAVVEAVVATGPAILIDSLSIAVGFSVLTLSQVPANGRLGALVALSVGVGFLATLCVIPVFLSFSVRKRARPL